MSDEPQQQGWTPRDATAADPPDTDKRPGAKTGPDDTDQAPGEDETPEADEARADDEARGDEEDGDDGARADEEDGDDGEPADEEDGDDGEPATEKAAPAGEDPDADEEPDEPAPSTHTAHAGATATAAVNARKTRKTRKKKGRASRPKRTGWRRAVPTWRVTLGALLFASLLVIGGLVTGYLLVDIPPANAAATAQTNVFLYEDGTHIARDGDVNRENVSLDDIPLPVRRAVLAAEDRDFYSAPAIDPMAMVRAAWNTVTGKGKQSGSTITQQYVKNYYLGQEQTITRKVKEFFIAIKLGRNQSKNEILEGYLNTSYFGRNAYGIQAAAHAYYGKDVQDLDTAQGAYLASLLNAPNAYDVATYPENKQAALARWKYVLGGMVKEKWLSAENRADLTFPMPERAKPVSGLSGQGGYIVQAVKEYLAARGILDEKTLATGGHRITTTLQRGKQDALSAAVDEQVNSQLDSEREADRNVRVGGVSVEPATGKVVAMYGGIDYTKQFVNNATRRDYQVGSTFKPFVIAAAVENRSTTQDGHPINPNTVYVGDSKRPVQGWSGARYAPENEDDVSYGPIPVRRAADESVNAVFAQMAVDVGPSRVMNTAIALGIPKTTPDLSPSPSIALGPATASVLDMAGAYATLANHGKHTQYTLVENITKNGTEVPLPEPSTEQAVSREAADTTTAVLRGVVDGGTGSAAQSGGRPAAGKTGTAEEDRAAWFAGYTPELATVVAVMGQNPKTGAQTPLYGALGMSRINGGGAPAQIWGQYTAAALEGTPVQGFDLRLAPGSNEPPPGQRDPEDPESGNPEDPYRPSDPGEQAGTGRDGGPWGVGGAGSRPGAGEGTGTGPGGPSGQTPRTPTGAGSPTAPLAPAPATPATGSTGPAARPH
ncbi:transglycosylase domain-containing protein [Streptomyces sp. V1I6]|uniref:transglycosylase domain-containing protein n=1 Tax=Streptomyces sp. V1I6 TaxID=3042273 RepID=UPI002780AA00|nr:transglycosylase domain-containing protein [Streptomyces sp. V1I6]MDQ0843029.1 membrane peptidoglycan carboxypeptidase [Streptomyces sp. V1I6]